MKILFCFPSLRDHDPLFPDVQCLENCGGHQYCLSLPGLYHTGQNWPSEGGPSFPGFRSQQPSNAGKNLMPQLGIRQREASISSLPTKWAGNSRYHITNPSIQAK